MDIRIRFNLSEFALLLSITMLAASCATPLRNAETVEPNTVSSSSYEPMFETKIATNTLYRDPILIRTSDGGYVVAGTGSRASAWISKIDKAGKLLWVQAVSPEGGMGSYQINTVMEMPDGGYVVAGARTNINGFVSKFGKNGNALWSKDYDPISAEIRYSAIIRGSTTVDGVILVSNVLEIMTDKVTNARNLDQIIRLTKIDSDGNVAWKKAVPSIEINRYSFFSADTSKIVADPQGNLIFSIAKQFNRRADGKNAVVFYKIDTQGNLIKRFDLLDTQGNVLIDVGTGLRFLAFRDYFKYEIIEMNYDFVVTSQHMLNQEFGPWTMLADKTGGMHFYGSKGPFGIVKNSYYPALVHADKNYNSSLQFVDSATAIGARGDAVHGDNPDEIVFVRVNRSGDSSTSILTKVRLKK